MTMNIDVTFVWPGDGCISSRWRPRGQCEIQLTIYVSYHCFVCPNSHTFWIFTWKSHIILTSLQSCPKLAHSILFNSILLYLYTKQMGNILHFTELGWEIYKPTSSYNEQALDHTGEERLHFPPQTEPDWRLPHCCLDQLMFDNWTLSFPVCPVSASTGPCEQH